MTAGVRPGRPGGVQAPLQRASDWLARGGARLVLAGGMAIYALFALWTYRGTTLFVDEQGIFMADRGLRPSALLAPYNGHLYLVERLVYAVDFRLFGASFVLPWLVEVFGVLLVVGLFFTLVARRVGPAIALAPSLLLLFFGTGWEQDLVPSGIAPVYAIVGGLGALLALERPGSGVTPRSTPLRASRRDLGACALLILAVSSWTLGVAFACGALVLILAQPGARRRLWIALLPLALYAAWLVWVRVAYVPSHGEAQPLAAANILLIPNYIADEVSSVVGALAGLNYDFSQSQGSFAAFATSSAYGPVLAVLAAAAVVIGVRRVGARSPSLWAFITTALVFWAALAVAYGFGRDATAARYVYAGGILVMLIGAEAARGIRVSPKVLLAVYLIFAAALGANLMRMRDGERVYRSFATSLRAQLTALELTRGRVPPTFMLAPPPSLVTIQAGPYFAAVARNGSPAYTVAGLLHQSETLRNVADSVLVRALAIGVSPHSPAESVGPCRRLASASGVTTSFGVQPPGVELTSSAPGQVGLRRFASAATVMVGTLQPGRPVDLRIPSDRSPRAWQVSIVTFGSSTLGSCLLPPGP